MTCCKDPELVRSETASPDEGVLRAKPGLAFLDPLPPLPIASDACCTHRGDESCVEHDFILPSVLETTASQLLLVPALFHLVASSGQQYVPACTPSY